MKIRALFVALLVLSALAVRADDVHEITIQHVLDGMNARRAEIGLEPLRIEPRLALAAEDRIEDMEDLGYWGHQAPDGRSPFLMLRKRDYVFSFAGENLAAGFETIDVLMDSWMESKGHRDNIMSPNFTECGIAVIDGSTAERLPGRSIVVLFARPMLPTLPVATDRSHEPTVQARRRGF